MSELSIASYLPFRRIKIISQSVLPDATESRVQARPDSRFQPVCHGCGQKVCSVHSWTERTVRDLNIATARVWIRWGDVTNFQAIKHSHSTRVDQMPVPQTVLPAMSGHPYRGFGAFPSLSSGNTADGPLYISIMPDAHRL